MNDTKNDVFVALAVVANTLGNFLLSVGMRKIQFSPSASPVEYLWIFANPWIDAGVILLIVWFASQLSLLSWADLSYVLPVTSTSYVLTALMGKPLLHESVSLTRWFLRLVRGERVILTGLRHGRRRDGRRLALAQACFVIQYP